MKFLWNFQDVTIHIFYWKISLGKQNFKFGILNRYYINKDIILIRTRKIDSRTNFFIVSQITNSYRIV
jgi:hypothetical protein